MLKQLALGTLTVHPENVRAVIDKKGTKVLAANIKAIGLINPLTVRIENNINWVVAGQRRLLALKLFKKDEDLIDCTIITRDIAAISLAENISREALKPGEQYAAFAQMEASMSIDEIAVIFDVTPFRVRQRLKLGRLAPQLLDALNKGTLTIQTAEVLTLTDDHKKQRRLFKAFPHEWQRHALRSTLIEKQFCTKDAAFDLNKYTGKITQDLFSPLDLNSEVGFFEDFEEALRLQTQAGELMVEPMEDEGWQWVLFFPRQLDWREKDRFNQLYRNFDISKDGVRSEHVFTKKEQASSGVLISFNGYWGIEIERGRSSIAVSEAKNKKKGEPDIEPPEAGSGDTWANQFKIDIHEMGNLGIRAGLTQSMKAMAAINIAQLIANTRSIYIPEGDRLSSISVNHNEAHPLDGQLASQRNMKEANITCANTSKFLSIPVDKQTPFQIYQEIMKRDPLQLYEALLLLLNNGVTVGPGQAAFNNLVKEVDVNWRDNWTPNKEFWSRLTKPQCMFVLEELRTPDEIVEKAKKMKRDEIHDLMTQVFLAPTATKEDYNVNGERTIWIKAVNRWLPPQFRAAKA